MLMHMENGGCELDVDCEYITSLAFECDFSGWYECSTGASNFECPTCETPFHTMGGLFQHVESDACEENMDKGDSLSKFLGFLRLMLRSN